MGPWHLKGETTKKERKRGRGDADSLPFFTVLIYGIKIPVALRPGMPSVDGYTAQNKRLSSGTLPLKKKSDSS